MNLTAIMQKTVNADHSKTPLSQSGFRIVAASIAYVSIVAMVYITETIQIALNAGSFLNKEWMAALFLQYVETFILGVAFVSFLYAGIVAASYGLAREFAGKGTFKKHAASCTVSGISALVIWGILASLAPLAQWLQLPSPMLFGVFAWLASLLVLMVYSAAIANALKKVHGFGATNAALAVLPFVAVVGYFLAHVLATVLQDARIFF